MRLFPIPGGVHPEYRKERTQERAIVAKASTVVAAAALASSSPGSAPTAELKAGP